MLFTIIYANVIWTAVISALVGALIVFLIFFFKNKNNGGAVANGKKLSDTRLIIEGIKNNAGEFAELYEPIYSVAAGKTKKQANAFTAFAEAAAGIEDADFVNAFTKKFGGCEAWGVSKKGKSKAKNVNKAYCKKARQLVKYFFKAGIIREHDLYVEGDDTTQEKYDFVGGVFEEGVIYDVLAPYWHLGNDVVDKGVIR